MSGLLCPSCDTGAHRPVSHVRRVWVGLAGAARVHGQRAWMAVVVAVLVVVVGRVLAEGDGGAWAPPGGAATPAGDAAARAPECLSVVAVNAPVSEYDVLVGRSGLAFAVRRTARWTDLLTDYYLVADRHLRGERTVSVFDGERYLVAEIMAVAREVNVARLRVPASVPPLRVAAHLPRPGARVTVLGCGAHPVSGIVLTYRGTGGDTHLVFSGVVPPALDGAPVLNAAREVVGVAEPSDEALRADGVGLAVPITVACTSVTC